MSVDQESTYPWLRREKQFISQAIAQKRFVLGICLGGQLISDCLGGRVTQNAHREIGWYDVTLTSDATDSLLGCLPPSFTAFHWHGDTFSVPSGAVALALSEACANQAFQYQDRVLALQFHLDYAYDSIQRMVDHCADELTDSQYVQKAVDLLAEDERVIHLQKHLYTLLDHCAAHHLRRDTS